MPSLHELQRAFADAIFHDPGVVPAPPDGIPAGAPMEVYRNNVFTNLSDGLSSIYSAVHALVGEQFFEHTAGQYVLATASRSGNLNDFGADFAAFLTHFEPARGLPYLPDVARVEWLIHEALLAADADPMDPATLAELSPADYGTIRFELHPSVRLMESDYPLLRIWELCQTADDGDEQPAINLDEGGARLLVARPRLQVDMTALRPGEYAFLDAIVQGLPFETVCTRALSVDADLDIGSTIRQQVTEGLIVGWCS
ncbi:MAG TPA: DNA-binding domain-containing protein [Gammaproteobacteria bacterium]|nr:DNA-binding domain-containing protein [Gammaproteobacteria bacterium]